MSNQEHRVLLDNEDNFSEEEEEGQFLSSSPDDRPKHKHKHKHDKNSEEEPEAALIFTSTSPAITLIRELSQAVRSSSGHESRQAVITKLEELSKLTHEDHAEIKQLVSGDAGNEATQSLTDAMEKFPGSHRIQLYASGLLYKMTAMFPTHAELLVKHGSIKLLQVAAAQFLADVSLQSFVLLAISTLTTEEAHRQLLLSSKAVGTAVAAMEKHQANATVQYSGCIIIGNLAFGGTAASAAGLSIVQHGGVHAVLKAMAAHPTDFNVQYRGCCALANLSYENHVCNVIAINGGAQLLIAALKIFSQKHKLVQRAFLALHNLVVDGHFGLVLLSSPAIGVKEKEENTEKDSEKDNDKPKNPAVIILQTLKINPSGTAALYGCRLVDCLARASPTAASALREAGAKEVVEHVAEVAGHSGDEKLKKKAAKVVAAFGDNPPSPETSSQHAPNLQNISHKRTPAEAAPASSKPKSANDGCIVQ